MAEALSSWTQRATTWTQDVVSSRTAQLAATAVVSGAVVAGTILGYQAYIREQDVKKLKSSIPDKLQDPIRDDFTHPPSHVAATTHHPETSKEDERSAALAARARQGDYDDDLILEQLARNRVFLKDEGLAKLRSSFIILVGCGGVGSHAAAALARSGVSKIRLIDFDQVTLSSLNRHAVATLADVGTPKVLTIKRRLEQIAPWVKFDCRNELFSKAVAEDQIGPWDGAQPSFVIDAIDNIDSKVDLLKYCHENKLRAISSMGAACKSDPTRIFIGDISTSTDDPLSRATRRRLKMRGVADGIPVVFSSEKSSPDKAALLPLPEEEFQKGNVGDLGVMPDFRVRILPVLGTMPAMFGLCIANHVMLTIGGYPHEYLQSKARDKMYDAILSNLQASEEKLARSIGDDAVGLRIPVTQDDVGYLVEEVYRGRSVVSGLSTRLVLTRWNPIDISKPMVIKTHLPQKSTSLKINDLVCMTKNEAARHEVEILRGGKRPEDLYSPDVLDLVKARMEEEARYSKYR